MANQTRTISVVILHQDKFFYLYVRRLHHVTLKELSANINQYYDPI